MNRRLALITSFLLGMAAAADNVPTKFLIWNAGEAKEYSVASSELIYKGNTVTAGGDTYELADIDSITFASGSDAEQDGTWGQGGDDAGQVDTVYVVYSGSSASVSALPSEMTATTSGADVSIEGTVSDREVAFVLSGQSSSGSFVYDGSYKCTVVLGGLTLTGSTAEAINVKDGKRIALVLADGTVNTLSDAASDGGQKAAFYTKGHLEISGGGELNLTGNVKHALSSKEYLLVKKTAGTINVTSAANDGLHAGQYVRINGGTITIANVGGDGIQAEQADDGEEGDGKLTINGGSLSISVSQDDCAALKSDSTLTVAGGVIEITTSGDADKGLKSKQDIRMEGGELTVVQSGSYLVEDDDTSYTTGLKADGDVCLSGGSLTISNSAKAGRGISADGNVAMPGGEVGVTMTGAGGKGVKSDGTFTLGQADTGEGASLSVTTTGARLSETSSSRVRAQAPGGSTGGGFSGGGGSNGGGTNGGGINGGGTNGGGTNGGGTNGPGGGNVPGGTGGSDSGSSGSAAKAIKAVGAAYVYGGSLEVSTAQDGAEGLESKTGVYIEGGKLYLRCYDDCINSDGQISFDGGVTVCYSTGNDGVDSNQGKRGAITIGNGALLAYSTKGSPEEGVDCDNPSYISISGTGVAITAGGSQNGGGTISGAAQGYVFLTSSLSFASGRYYTLADSSGKNLVSFSFESSCQSSLSLMTATGMASGSTYTVKYSTAEPSDAVTAFHGLYLGSSASGTTSLASFTAK